MTNKHLDPEEHKRLRSGDLTVARTVRLPTIALEVVEDLAREYRDEHQPRNRGRRPETSWVVSYLVVEALTARGLLTRDGGGRLRPVSPIDDLL